MTAKRIPFDFNRKIDVKEEWVTDAETGVELLISTAKMKQLEAVFSTAGEVDEVSKKPVKDVTGDEETAVKRQIEAVAYFAVKDWRGEMVDGQEYAPELFYRACVELDGLSMFVAAAEKLTEMKKAINEKVAAAKGKPRKA